MSKARKIAILSGLQASLVIALIDARQNLDYEIRFEPVRDFHNETRLLPYERQVPRPRDLYRQRKARKP